MASVVIYDPSDPIVANKVTEYLQSVNTPNYQGNPNTLIDPNLSSVSGVDQKYWKVDTGSVVEMTTAEKDDIDEEEAAQDESSTEDAAVEEKKALFYKMLRRVKRRQTAWSLTDADIRNFKKDLFADSQDLKELYLTRVKQPLINFIDTYDATNAKFTQARQNILIGILNS